MGRPPKGVPHPKKIRFDVENSKDIESRVQKVQKALDRLTQLDEAGEYERLLEAVEVFLSVAAPGSYLAKTFARRLRCWQLWQVPDLAEAFGVKRTSDPRTIATERRQMKLAPEILIFLTNCKRRGVVLHKDAVKQTAKKFRVGVSFVEAICRDNPDLRTFIENMPTLMLSEPESRTRRMKKFQFGLANSRTSPNRTVAKRK
jgi:hypothetical protein